MRAGVSRERYAQAFAAHLERAAARAALGAAYALGREAVAAQLSVLDFADAHHGALTVALAGARQPPGRRSQAGADVPAREPVDVRDRRTAATIEVQEVARIEHEYVEQLRALADASVAINSSLTVEEILQLTADAARAIARARRARRSRSWPPDPRLRAARPRPRRPRLERRRRRHPRATERRACRRAGASSASLEVVDAAGREFTRARRGDPHPARPARVGRDRQRAALRARAHDRAHAAALAAPGRAARRPRPVGRRALPRRPARGSSSAATSTTSSAAGDGGWTALIGDVQGKGPEAAAVTALARHTLRAAAAYEHRPSGVLTLLHRALREQAGDGRFCTVAYAHLQVVPRPAYGSSWPAAGTRCRSSCTPTAASSRSAGSARCSARTSSRCSTDVAVELEPGDVLVLYTDGVTEVRRRRRRCSATAQLSALLRDVRRAAAGRGRRARRGGGHGRLEGRLARRHGDPGLRPRPDAPNLAEETDG